MHCLAYFPGVGLSRWGRHLRLLTLHKLSLYSSCLAHTNCLSSTLFARKIIFFYSFFSFFQFKTLFLGNSQENLNTMVELEIGRFGWGGADHRPLLWPEERGCPAPAPLFPHQHTASDRKWAVQVKRFQKYFCRKKKGDADQENIFVIYSRVQRLSNLSSVLGIMQRERARTEGVDPANILEGDIEQTLDLVWKIVVRNEETEIGFVTSLLFFFLFKCDAIIL